MRPPLLASSLLRILAAGQDRQFLLEDLREEFESVARERGERAARRWYWRQALASCGPLLAARLPEGPRLALVGPQVRLSFRRLRTAPAATAVAVVTLALGIGANTAVFSVVDAVLLRPLPYRAPERLVSVWQTRSGQRLTVGLADFVEYSAQTQTFESLAAYSETTRVLAGGIVPEETNGDMVTWNLFAVIGAQPSLGRPFVETDARSGAQPTVILSSAFWKTRFGSDPSILGRTILLSNEPHLVVGVMSQDFQPPSHFGTGPVPNFFLPAPQLTYLDAVRGDHELQAIGRLRPAASATQAQDELRRIDERLARAYPASNANVLASVAPLAADMTRRVRVALLVVLGAVGLVLLIASLNVANLLIVKAFGQRQEVAIRLALGASRADIIVDYVLRGLTLSALGGALGLAVGSWTRTLLVSAAPATIPRLDAVALNPRILAATALLSVITGVVAGLVPALQVARARASGGLRISESASSGSPSVRRWQGALMACEVAAAIVIALGAGLLVRSLIVLNGVDLGFETERVLTFRLRPAGAQLEEAPARLAFFQEVSARLARIPGVQMVAFANAFPMRGGWGGGLLIDGPAGPVQAEADFQAVSASYFTVLGIPVIRGRLLTEADGAGAPPVVVVSQTFAATLLAGRDPIGAQIRRDRNAPALTIVGVVGEIRRDGKFADATPQVFFSAYQTGVYATRLEAIALRSATGDPRSLVPTIQREVATLDPALPIMRVRTLDEILSASLATRRFNMLLLSSFAGLALLLAIIGVYGVVTHAAQQRTREIGIRAALGATRRNVVGLIVRATFRWTLPGLAAGLLVAWASSRLMTTMLFGITPNDPITYCAVTALMLAVSATASYIPARRAATVDPLRALKTM